MPTVTAESAVTVATKTPIFIRGGCIIFFPCDRIFVNLPGHNSRFLSSSLFRPSYSFLQSVGNFQPQKGI